MQIRRVVALGIALVLAMAGSPALAQRNNNDDKQPKRSKAEQADIDTLVKVVDAVSAGQPAPTDVSVVWESNHFVKGQNGVTYVPFTLAIDRSQLPKDDASLYIRVVDKNAAAPAASAEADKDDKDKEKDADKQAAPDYAWSTIHFIELPDDGKVSRAIALPAGSYDAYIAVKDKGTDDKNAPAAKVGLVHHDLDVPDFTAAELTTSSVILAKSVEPMTTQLSPDKQEENPYVFGPMKIVPSPDGKFAKSSELQVIFWIYGASEAASGKPDVQVDYNFHQRLPEGEKYFNKTAPQELNAQSLPPEFSVAAGHQLPGSLVVPLTSFPEGDYRLEIKVTDKPTGKTVTQNVNFTVSPS